MTEIEFTSAINEVISKSLPTQVGTVLQQRLAEATSSAALVKKLQTEVEEKNKRIAALEATVSRAGQIDEREKAVATAQKAFDIQKAVADAVEIERKLRVEDLKNVTLAVFANAKYKYWKTDDMPVAVTNSGYTSVQRDNRHVVGEHEGPGHD